MKLRFKDNTIRLRLNQIEVQALADGQPLEQHVLFPGGGRFSYCLGPVAGSEPGGSFRDGTVEISVPMDSVRRWAAADEIGLYFALPAANTVLKIAMEKDLECLDGPLEERDPAAYARPAGVAC